ncbi:MAG TPA: hypothetical protein VN279_09425, partial [Rhodocyclaceae bacterium]|nr:hypothetical protein [Rhodocyclaceae bacterium]
STRGQAAAILFDMNLALLVGYVALAAFSTRLARRGLKPIVLLAAGSGLTVAIGLLILVDAAPAPLLWSLLGFSVCVGNLSYPLVTAAFPAERSGRANTALNLMVFVGAFGVQWGFGAVVDLSATHGADPVRSFRIAFAILLALQAASYAWFMLEGRRRVE